MVRQAPLWIRASTESLHSVPASAEKETPSQAPLTQLFFFPPSSLLFFQENLDKGHSFYCDILLRLFWNQPSVAFLQRAGATSFSFLPVIQDTQQTLWSTAQWPRKKPRRTMSFAHTHIQRHARTLCIISIWACRTQQRHNWERKAFLDVFPLILCPCDVTL